MSENGMTNTKSLATLVLEYEAAVATEASARDQYSTARIKLEQLRGELAQRLDLAKTGNGTAGNISRSPELTQRDRIVSVMRTAAAPLNYKDIAARAGVPEGSANAILSNMLHSGDATRTDAGVYALAS